MLQCTGVGVSAHLYEEQIFTGVIAVMQACCKPFLQSSTEQWASTNALQHWSGQMHSQVSSVALQNWFTGRLSHCNCTCGDLLFIPLCKDLAPMLCNTDQGKIRFPLISSTLQNSLTAGVVSLQLQPWRVAFHTPVQRLSTNALQCWSLQMHSQVFIVALQKILTAGIVSLQFLCDEA